MQDNFRRSTLTLPLPGSPLVAANGVVTYVSPRAQRIVSAQLSLSDSGVGAGSTAVNLKVNGNTISAAGSLSVAGAAGSKSVSASITTASQFPGGFRVNEGDTITVDVASVPGTTAPKAGFVTLDIVELDI